MSRNCYNSRSKGRRGDKRKIYGMYDLTNVKGLTQCDKVRHENKYDDEDGP